MEERRRQQVRRLLARAERQMVFRQHLTPPGDNAVDSYRQVLKLDPDNAEARSALAGIAADQLRQARQASDPATRLAAVQSGLRAQPEHQELLALRAQLTGQPDPTESERLAAERQRQAQRRQEEQRRRQIAALVTQAQDQAESGRLVEPAGDNALDSYRQVLDLDPGNPAAQAGLVELVDTLTQRARRQRQSGELDAALETLAQGLRVNPRDQDLLALGEAVRAERAEQDRRRLEEARRQQRIARLLAAAERRFQAGQLIEPTGTSAADSYRRVLDLDPGNSEARAGLAQLAATFAERAAQAQRGGDLQASLKAIAQGLSVRPDDRTLLALREAVQVEQAERERQRLEAERRARQLADLLATARRQVQAGRWVSPEGDNALDSYRRLLTLDPGNPEAEAGLRELTGLLTEQAQQQRRADDLDTALDTIAQGLRVNPRDRDLLALDETVRSEQAERERQRLEAERRARRVTELLDAAYRHFQAGRLLTPAGGSAVAAYRQVLALEPDNPVAQAGLGRIVKHYTQQALEQQQQGALEAALSAAVQGLSVDPENAALLSLRASLQTEQAERQRRARQVAEGLAAARRLVQAGKLVEPDEENAAASYRAVLDLEPGNAEAQVGLERIADALRAHAEQRRQAGDLEAALTAVKAGLGARPGDRELLALWDKVRDELTERQRRARQVAETLAAARGQFQAGRLVDPEGDNATASYRAILALDPDNAEAQAGLERIAGALGRQASDQRRAGDLEAALATVAAGLGVRPRDRELLALRDKVQDELAERQRRARQVAETLAAARGQFQAGKLVDPQEDNATASYRAVLALDPENAEAQAGLERVAAALGAQAEQRRQGGDLEASLALLDQALTVTPDDPKLRRQREAVEAEQDERRRQQQRIAELLVVAQEQFQAGKLVVPEGDNAAASYREVLSLDPNNAPASAGLERIVVGYLRLAQGRLEAGALEPALAAVEAGLSVDPRQSALLQLRDRAQAELAERERRARELATLLAQARVQEQASRLAVPPGDNAVDSYRRVLELEPDHPQAKAALARLAKRLDGTARQRLRSGELEAALAQAEGGLRADPDHDELLKLRGEIRDRLAERERRRQEIDTLLAAARRQTEAGRLTEPAGDNAQASYRRVLELDPDNPAAKAGLDDLLARAEQDLKNKLAEWRRIQEQLDAEEQAIRESIQQMLSEDRERRSD